MKILLIQAFSRTGNSEAIRVLYDPLMDGLLDTCLTFAVTSGYLNTVRFLLENSRFNHNLACNLVFVAGILVHNALIQAFNGHLNIAEYLNEQGFKGNVSIESQNPLNIEITAAPCTDSKLVLIHLGSRCLKQVPPIVTQKLNLYEFTLEFLNFWTDECVFTCHSSQLNQPNEFRFNVPSSMESVVRVLLKTDGKATASSTVFLEESGIVQGLWGEKSESGQRTRVNLCDSNGRLVSKLTMEFFMVKPLSNSSLFDPLVYKNAVKTVIKSPHTLLIGHRGLGMNKPVLQGECKLQLGENTIPSFKEAYKSGAQFVEFDIQLTRDGIPVVYHDWNMEEISDKVTVNSLSIEEFRNVHKEPHPWVGTLLNSRLKTPICGRSFDDSCIKTGSDGKLEPAVWPWKGNGDGTIQAEFASMSDLFEVHYNVFV